jgi:hypothetical protein
MKLILAEKPEIVIPFLYEVWNWVGDTSILPTKWYELLKKNDNQTNSNAFSSITRELLLNQYVRNEKFDPNGFFFLTTRSEVVSGVLVWPISRDTCQLVALVALPAHRDKQVAQAIISLAIVYAINKGYSEVIYNNHE